MVVRRGFAVGRRTHMTHACRLMLPARKVKGSVCRRAHQGAMTLAVPSWRYKRARPGPPGRRGRRGAARRSAAGAAAGATRGTSRRRPARTCGACTMRPAASWRAARRRAAPQARPASEPLGQAPAAAAGLGLSALSSREATRGSSAPAGVWSRSQPPCRALAHAPIFRSVLLQGLRVVCAAHAPRPSLRTVTRSRGCTHPGL